MIASGEPECSHNRVIYQSCVFADLEITLSAEYVDWFVNDQSISSYRIKVVWCTILFTSATLRTAIHPVH
jgi:hypothetical protein